ncbi:MAG: hypothetical protein GXP30_03180, partial [Verrucomicrobia bacterium]|nr:hypothetical protein [Verrucomicrobiota bacterium]
MSTRSILRQPTTRSFTTLLIPLFVGFAAYAVSFFPTKADAADANFADIGMRVAKMLAEEHYSQHPFDDVMSERLLDNYIRLLDYGRQYFTQQDIDGFYEKYRHNLDDDIKAKDLSAAYDIYDIYLKRVNSRVATVKEILEKNELDFTSDKTVHLSRKKEKWPADEAAANELWHRIIEGEMLQANLRKEALAKREAEEAEKKKASGDTSEEKVTKTKEHDSKDKDLSPKDKIIKRYDRFLKNVTENDKEDIAVIFIKSLTRGYDPHSEYFSQSQYDNFRISMSKSLKGIGAMLSLDEESGAAEIQGLVVGGPAYKNGELKVKDRIVKVGQDKKGKMVDIVGEKLGD